MEIIGFLIVAAIVCFVGFWLLVIGGVVLIFLWMAWPAVLGIVGGIAIWINGADNAGVLFALGCFVGQYFWFNYIEDGHFDTSYDPMPGKRKHYDKQGKLTGYSDKD